MAKGSSNRIGTLRQIIDALDSQPAKQTRATKFARLMASEMLAKLRQEAPVGTVEPDYTYTRGGQTFTVSHGRPSLRQHGVTLESSWANPEISSIKDGANFSISSKAPHMEFLIGEGVNRGSRQIPSSGGPVSFFWLREVKPMIRDHINHPGFPKSTFPERARALFDEEPYLRQMTYEHLTPLRKFTRS